MTEDRIKLPPIEQAMLWERMSGERLSDAERQRILDGGEFVRPGDQPVETETDPQKRLTQLYKQIHRLHVREQRLRATIREVRAKRDEINAECERLEALEDV